MLRRWTVLLLAALRVHTFAFEWTLEAEDSVGLHNRMQRSKASQNCSVRLEPNNFIMFQICLMQSANITIKDVVFSNDGLSDNITVSIDNIVIGIPQTLAVTNHGTEWNNFHSSGPLGTRTFSGGIHRLFIHVTDTDSIGAEIDKIVLEVDDKNLNSKIFLCKYPCLQNMPSFPSVPDRESIPKGHIVQKSYETQCAEEDNVHIPVFHETVKEYVVSAQLPIYHSFRNARVPDFTDCKMENHYVWLFRDIKMKEIISGRNFSSNQTVLHLTRKSEKPSGVTLQVGLSFNINPKDVSASQMGGTILLSLSGLTGSATVTLTYRGKTIYRYITLTTYVYSKTSPSHEWPIEDFTWNEQSNEVIFMITLSQPEKVVIDELYLKRRQPTWDKKFNIYNGDIMVDGQTTDFWWMEGKKIDVSLSTSNQTWQAHYIQVYVPVPWVDDWCQVMVMYQDGYIRLLPITPQGTPAIPFGTSVLVGQADQGFRPSAPIRHLHIIPEKLSFKLEYYDGGSATLTLAPLIERTELHVSDLVMSKDRNMSPFATFRTMYVEGGNADADSVATDADISKHIIDDWGILNGTGFCVFRRCESSHIPQSPDLCIRIVRG